VTEAERLQAELELLQLEEEEAQANVSTSRLVPQRGGASGGWGYPDPGPLRAIATKFNAGLTKKASDELVGAIGRTRVEPVPGQYLRLPDGREVPATTAGEVHRAFREGERQNQGAAEQHYPKIGFGAEMVGEVAGDIALAGSRMVSPVYQALVGGARGYFGTNSDDAVDQIAGTGLGGTLGYAFGKIPEAAAAVSRSAPIRAIAESNAGRMAGDALRAIADAAKRPSEALRRFAARRATSAAGLIQKDLNKLPPGAAVDIGEELLDRGAIKAFKTAEELRPAIIAARKDAGKEVGSVLGEADAVSGGTGPQVRRAVSGRRLANQNLRDAWSEAEAMHVDAAQTQAAEDMAKRRAFVAAEKSRLLSDALVTGKNREKLATELAEDAAAKEFGDRGTEESFRRAGTLPPDIAREAIPPTPPQELTRGLGFDAHRFADAMESKLLPELQDPILKPLKTQMQNLLAGYRAKAARGMSHAEANAWKSTIQKTIAKFQDAPISSEAKIKLQGILDDEIERSIGEKVGADAIPRYRSAKEAFGLLREAEKGNRTAIARADGNNRFGLTELLAMGAGGTMGAGSGGSVGAMLGGAALSGGAHLLKHRGASTAAVAANKLSGYALQAVESAPQLFGDFGAIVASQKTPQARAAVAEELALRFPEFAEMLERFSASDSDARAAVP
jgi:hypothetical protein